MHYLLRRLRRVKLILPALTEATSPDWRPIKYSLFPPLGLATLAAYLDPALDVTLQDEHVEPLDLDDEPDLVVIQVYITNAYRAYRIADHYRRKGAHVALGGLHVTSLPEEAAQLYGEMHAAGRLLTDDWDRYDTRHVVYRPAAMTPVDLKRGYDWAYREFYRWTNIFSAASTHQSLKHSAKHLAYSAGWKTFEPAGDVVIRMKQLAQMRPMLEAAAVAGAAPRSNIRSSSWQPRSRTSRWRSVWKLLKATAMRPSSTHRRGASPTLTRRAPPSPARW